MPIYKPTYKGNSKQIKKAVAAIKSAKRPLAYIGGGAISSNAAEPVRKLLAMSGIQPCRHLWRLAF